MFSWFLDKFQLIIEQFPLNHWIMDEIERARQDLYGTVIRKAYTSVPIVDLVTRTS